MKWQVFCTVLFCKFSAVLCLLLSVIILCDLRSYFNEIEKRSFVAYWIKDCLSSKIYIKAQLIIQIQIG